MAENSINELLPLITDWGGKRKPALPWRDGEPTEIGQYNVAMETLGDALKLAVGFMTDMGHWVIEGKEVPVDRVRYWAPIPPLR